jgi:hypothetical protein
MGTQLLGGAGEIAGPQGVDDAEVLGVRCRPPGAWELLDAEFHDRAVQHLLEGR